MVKIGDICNVRSGYAFKSDEFISNEVPVIRIGNVTVDGLFIDNNICFDNDFWESNPNYRVNLNDILIAMSGATVGKSCQNTNSNKLLLNQRVAAISCDNYMTLRYIYHAINSSRFMDYVLINSAGCAQPNISIKQLSNFSVPNKPECEQKRIVDILDKLEKLICLRKQQLKKVDELVKSRFIEIFGDTVLNPYKWNKEPLGRVCDVRDGTHDSPQYYDTGYPLVTSKNLSSGDIDFAECSLICQKDFDKINERSKVDFGDILMPMIGTVGNPVIVKNKREFAIKNVALIKFYNDTRVSNVYIKTLLKSDYFDSEVISKVRGGTQKFISLGDIRKLEVLVPPLELQKEFATFVEQTEKLKLEVKESLEKLETLKKSLMQKYFG